MIPVSEVIGGLPFLSNIFDYGPLIAALITFVLLFVVTYALICVEWGYRVPLREFYVNFLACDGIVYPGYMALATNVLKNARLESFWASPLWHWGVFIFGVILSLAICWYEVVTKKYSLKMQWTPWKLWHTLMFWVAFYWIVSTLPILLLQGKFWITSALALGVLMFVYTSILDGWLPGAPKAKKRLYKIWS